jgi:hypothetical protein
LIFQPEGRITAVLILLLGDVGLSGWPYPVGLSFS